MNQEGMVPWVLKEVGLVSLSPLPPLFTTSILELSLFFGKIYSF